MAYSDTSQVFRTTDDIEQHTTASELVQLGKEESKKTANELIKTYDNPFNRHDVRDKAFHVVVTLAKQYDLVLDLVINNARRYIETQYIDDASPYSPNSFDVLSAIGKANPKVISFLSSTLKDEWGIPR